MMFRHSTNPSPFCCGLQELGHFLVPFSPDHKLTEDEREMFASVLRHRPMTTCTTVLEYRPKKRYDDDDEEYIPEPYEPDDAQGTMNSVLPHLGFKPVTKFTGNEGNLVQLWVYVRPDNQAE